MNNHRSMVRSLIRESCFHTVPFLFSSCSIRFVLIGFWCIGNHTWNSIITNQLQLICHHPFVYTGLEKKNHLHFVFTPFHSICTLYPTSHHVNLNRRQTLVLQNNYSTKRKHTFCWCLPYIHIHVCVHTYTHTCTCTYIHCYTCSSMTKNST